jgi:exonuclease VII large subunit
VATASLKHGSIEAWILLFIQGIIDKAASLSHFVFENDKTLVSFTSKKGKSVVLLSTISIYLCSI